VSGGNAAVTRPSAYGGLELASS